jgi:23S rRNA pseudouridine955/2504/2580 synthase/23S rRNA pseudouridine1911/1915/1917 synthase
MEDEERPLLNRLALHAWKLSLPAPDRKNLELEAPIPKDLEACLKQLRKWKKK